MFSFTHITDIHYSKRNDLTKFKKVLDNEIADIIIVTGDLVDANDEVELFEKLEEIRDLLIQTDKPFYVTSDHHDTLNERQKGQIFKSFFGQDGYFFIDKDDYRLIFINSHYMLEDGKMDYMNRGKIPLVKEGDLLAQKELVQEGGDGLDVFGKPITASKQKDMPFLAGDGTDLSADKTGAPAVRLAPIRRRGRRADRGQHRPACPANAGHRSRAHRRDRRGPRRGRRGRIAGRPAAAGGRRSSRAPA